MTDLSRIAIVLVETSSPGNLGSVARVMKNMGLDRLVLVDCRADLSEEARQRARGADDLLEKSRTDQRAWLGAGVLSPERGHQFADLLDGSIDPCTPGRWQPI